MALQEGQHRGQQRRCHGFHQHAQGKFATPSEACALFFVVPQVKEQAEHFRQDEQAHHRQEKKDRLFFLANSPDRVERGHARKIKASSLCFARARDGAQK